MQSSGVDKLKQQPKSWLSQNEIITKFAAAKRLANIKISDIPLPSQLRWFNRRLQTCDILRREFFVDYLSKGGEISRAPVKKAAWQNQNLNG